MRKSRLVFNPAFIALIIFCLWFGYAFWIESKYSTMGDRGLHGDMYGGLNALFSGLAFAGVIYTIHLQREELALQRKELELTREELKRTADASAQSAVALGKQIEAQFLSARLSALSTLLDSTNRRIQEHNESTIRDITGYQKRNFVNTRNQIEEELNQLLNKIRVNLDTK
jgi:hypothetical protein